ncbi:hypothetical protein Hamer_G018716, partial [Homarus americanus]
APPVPPWSAQAKDSLLYNAELLVWFNFGAAREDGTEYMQVSAPKDHWLTSGEGAAAGVTQLLPL